MDYQTAVTLRIRAETATDPDAYERAAAEFDALDMPASAAACRDRARHYRAVAARMEPATEIILEPAT